MRRLEFVGDVVVVAVGGGAGDHFADETGQEEDDTQDQGDEGKVEERLNIESVSREDIDGMLERAGYLNIRTFVKSGTTWLCAVAEKE